MSATLTAREDRARGSRADAPPARLEEVRTLPELLRWRAARSPSGIAYRECARGTDEWLCWSWQQVCERVDHLASGLAAMNLEPGARVAILLANSADATCIDQAVLACGCVPVPLHALDNPASIGWILADSGASVLFSDSDTQWLGIAALGLSLPRLQLVVARRIAGLPVTGRPVELRSLASWLEASPWVVPRAAAAVGEHDLAALVYTSGTTGRPKGVMLTHGNVLSNVRASLERFAPREDDVFLSFLPLSHTFERTAGYYLPIAAGSCVAYARSVQELAQDLRNVQPTVLVSVPRIYEKLYARLPIAAASARQPRFDPFGIAVAAGWRRFLRRQGRLTARTPGAVVDAVVHAALDPFVGRALRAQLGGRLRLAVSGGAPLAPAIARCFLGLGIDLVQGYGMTETSPVVACNAVDDNDPGTVGRPLGGVEVRLGEAQELQVRGPNVMRGYWNRPDETAAAFIDGWLRTGDQAALEDGRIRIVGRLKDILVTATGEKIAPADVEQAILADRLFEQAFVFGEGRPFIGCIVVLAAQGWRDLAAHLALEPEAAGSLEAPAAVAAVMARIERLTAHLPHHGQPRRAVLTRVPWTLDNGLLTPTLKLKRLALQARFADVIDALYARPAGPGR
jgi:long-chain acyl-CoA synthetase